MFDFPLEKYKFYTDGKRKVVAISTYNGQTIRGVATCAPEDEFSFEKGKELAAARCNFKVAEKRYAKASKARFNALINYIDAGNELSHMDEYLVEAGNALMEASERLYNDLKEF